MASLLFANHEAIEYTSIFLHSSGIEFIVFCSILSPIITAVYDVPLVV